MNIDVISASSVPTPPAGERTLFVNADNSLLTWKYDDGSIHLFSDTDGDADCCACEISKDYADGLLCALKSGILAAADFNALISLGFTVNVNETTDPTTGNTTCSVVLGTSAAAIVNPVSLIIIPNVTTLTSGVPTQQYYAQFTPANTTNQAVNWISSDPTKATVNSSGLVTRVAVGTTTIYCYSVANNAVFNTKVLTLS